MHSFTLLVTLALASAAYALPSDKYTDKYDNINIDEILENQKLLNGYIDCIMDRGKCSAEAKELKTHMIEALETHCEKCTKAQNENSRKVIKHMINKVPKSWAEITEKYDKDHKYSTRYEEELKTLTEE